ncbi:transcriptional coactivator/pterin dehydratase [Meira miltonrushii]|uniref:4a-hydroxytetrahydrobiopterin dehydratase n=1 Tax=Meira miltonrushii TaxID=1280837 RepID=A0A316VFW8_9BASI|nr:transcriptional coactivator/pterin dehydratase [Meira miltonrushii]PWN36527.1 transcriptional coactivator/pterin dehydratase [Meira miltonrushii]
MFARNLNLLCNQSTNQLIPTAFSRTVAPQQIYRSMSSSPTAAQASKLSEEVCEPCRKTTPVLPASEYDNFMKDLRPGWEIKPFIGSGELGVLQRSFTFKNFRYALAFTNAVGTIAEQQKHHPEIVLGWGHVEIAWWSHAIGGLHKNDFVCAAKTDEAAAQAEGLKNTEI